MTNENPISEREREILRLVATGATNQQIAIALNISVNTVKVHLRNIFAKIGVESRTEATVYAIRTGIVTVGETGMSPADETAPVSIQEAAAIAEAAQPPITAPSEPETSVGSTDTPTALPDLSSPADQISDTGTVLLTIQETPLSPTQPAALPTVEPWWRRLTFWLIAGVALIVVAVTILMVNARSAQITVPTNPTISTIISGQQRWFLRQPLSDPRDHFALTGYDLERRLYVIGGEQRGMVSAAVDRYDPETDRWVRLTDKPTAVSHARAITLRGRIFVPGGEDATGTVTDRLEIYDPREQRWFVGPPLPAPRSRYALVAWEGQMYLIGGWDGTALRSEVFVYDPVRERWETGPALSQPRQNAGVAVAGGRLYIVGGEGIDGALRDSARLEPGNDSDRRWIATAPLPQAIARPVAVGLPSTLLIFDSERRQGLTYDIAADAWSQTPLPADAYVSSDAVLLESNIYFMGDSRAQGRLSEYRALYVVFIPGQ
jgi:DNA-binding CsgD family transcriptional regulator